MSNLIAHSTAIINRTGYSRSDEKRRLPENIEKLKNKFGSLSLIDTTLPTASNRSLEEILFDARAAVKMLTSRVSMHIDSSTREKLFKQIDLMHDADEWDIEDSPISPSSYASFLKWIVLASPARAPGLGMGSSGNLIAVWMDGADRLVLEFLKGDSVKWLVKRSNAEGVEVGSGQAKIARVSAVLAPYNVDTFLD